MSARKDPWAIGDVHGCLNALRRLLDKIGPGSDDRLIFVGDYIDRGPDSKGVVDELLGLRRNGTEVVALAGNHDLMLVQLIGALRGFYPADILEPELYLSFLIPGNGFAATAQSYGWQLGASIHELLNTPSLCKLPEEHLEFFLNLQLSHLEARGPGYLCLHAGLNMPALRMKSAAEAVSWTLENSPNDFVELRGLFTVEPTFPEILVHGHTPWTAMLGYLAPSEHPLFTGLPAVVRRRINLDSGAASKQGSKLLTAVRLTERVEDIEFVQASEAAC